MSTENTPSTAPQPKKNWLVGGIAILVIAAIAIVVSAVKGNKPPTDAETNNETSGVQTPNAKYKDGTYAVVGHYRAPSGEEQFDATITLVNDVITDTSITITTQHPTSQQFEKMFADNFKPLVIGKKLDEVQLTKVSGSSLTPIGFNDALEAVKEQALL